MKNLFFIALFLIGCQSSTKTEKRDTSQAAIQERYLRAALNTESYKREWISVQKVIIHLKNLNDSQNDNVINEYNDVIGKKFGFVDNVSEAKNRIDKNSKDYLRGIQLNIAADLALRDLADENALKGDSVK